jgi:hypothetical protein
MEYTTGRGLGIACNTLRMLVKACVLQAVTAKMSARGENRTCSSPDEPTIPLCVSLVIDKDKISNRIYSFNLHKTWSEILVEIASELEKSDVLDLKTTGMENVTVQISANLNGSEVFYPDTYMPTFPIYAGFSRFEAVEKMNPDIPIGIAR